MTEVEILEPAKGHYLVLAAALVCLIFAASLSASTFYDALFVGREEPTIERIGWIFLLWIVVLPLAVLPGRYVTMLGEVGVSKPSLFPRREPKLITAEMVARFARGSVYVDGDKAQVVVLETKAGKRIRYTEVKTPGCTEKLLVLMERWRVPENRVMA